MGDEKYWMADDNNTKYCTAFWDGVGFNIEEDKVVNKDKKDLPSVSVRICKEDPNKMKEQINVRLDKIEKDIKNLCALVECHKVFFNSVLKAYDIKEVNFKITKIEINK